jgi:spermidine synthase
MFMQKAVYLAGFFISGFAALLYQVVWVRQLEILLGSSTLSATAVVASFMGGLALGAAIASRLISRIRRPTAAFAGVQLLLGIFAVAFPKLVEQAAPIIAFFYNHATASYSLAVFTVAFLILLIPTSLMGSTFSLMIKILAAFESGEKTVAKAYALNTLGAAAGVLATGFYLMGNLGLRSTALTGVALNLILAAAFLLTARFFRQHAATEIRPPTTGESLELVADSSDSHIENAATAPGRASDVESVSGFWRYYLATFLMGFAGMAYEILVFRHSMYFLPYVYNNIYLFPAVVFAFCLWIGVGSYVAGMLTTERQQKILPAALFMQGLYIIFSSHLFLQFDFLNTLFFENHVWNLFIKACILLMPPAFLSGFCFPVLCRYVMTGLPVKSASSFYTCNTVGSVLGPFAATFIFIPMLGIQRSFILIGSLPIFILVIAFRTIAGRLSAALIAVILIMLFIKPDPGYIPEAGHELLVYQENRDATAVVTRNRRGEMSLYINDHEAAGTDYTHYRNQIMMSLVPLALHPDPRQVLVICLGTGVTAGTCLRDPRVQRVTTVEISPSVKKLLPMFYPWNGLASFAENPDRFNLVIDDGRSFVTSSERRFDIITSEPLHPKRAGTVNLYSYEYYQLCRRRLNEGGIVAQWLPYHAMTLDEFRAIIATFASSFKHSLLWIGEQGVLVGSDKPLKPSDAAIVELLDRPEIVEVTRKGGYNTELFLAGFWMNEAGMRAYTGSDIRILSDDLPWIEYSRDGSSHDVFSPMITHRQSPQTLFASLDIYGDSIEAAVSENIDFLYYRIHQLAGDEKAAVETAARMMRSRYQSAHFFKMFEIIELDSADLTQQN